MRKRTHWLVAVAVVWPLINSSAHGEQVSYVDLVMKDEPVAYWRFSEQTPKLTAGSAEQISECRVTGKVSLGTEGPRPAIYPDFSSHNTAVTFRGDGGRLRIPDPGADSPLDVNLGETITLEAWVNPTKIGNGQHAYVLGKGRTHQKGFSQVNHNYALRLTGRNGAAHPSFLFATRPPEGEPQWHRWTGDQGFPIDGRWHHVAVSYTFGKPETIRGYVDGKPVKGTWDMAGATTSAPVVDDDELWIGSSMGGNPGSSFDGSIDEVALYHKTLGPERIRQRYRAVPPKPYVRKDPLPKDAVLVEIFENIPSTNVAPTVPPTTTYTQRAFGFLDYPQKYSSTGSRIARQTPLLFRATARLRLPEGDYQFLLRTRGEARLYVDGKELVSIPKLKLPGNGHGHVVDVRKIKEPHLRQPWPGDNETVLSFRADGQAHAFRLDMTVGEKNRRPETGETCIAIRQGNDRFHLLGFAGSIELTNDDWIAYAKQVHQRIAELDQQTRFQRSTQERAYWDRRHQLIREQILAQPAPKVPQPESAESIHNDIDRFINARLEEAKIAPNELVDDWAFLRRVTIDIIGTVPTEAQIRAYFADQSADRRENYIAKLLGHPGWADNWVGYWQDVLAENPNVLKPTLNNTGPFRWWIYESFLDNKSFDRFATELIMMDDGKYVGGPAGFAMAAQNDAPMAAKAHIIGQAFLGLEMKCARCHDAPFHDFTQKNLFAMAAMLNRGPQPVPNGVPLPKEAIESLNISVSLKPGSKVAPTWPFAELVKSTLPKGILRDPKDTRERLAGLITAPTNERFAKVIVNRLWRRYMGRGLVEPVDDWEFAQPSHPELLNWLARELIVHDYDLKHVAALILNSHTYQREAVSRTELPDLEAYLFPGPVRRRMTAEQIVDSLFVVAGKDLRAGEINFDVDGAFAADKFLNLGKPRRAWQFASLSNERDRPSLSLPFAQDFVSLLETFGWRSARQSPLTTRDQEPTVLQPAILANGVVTARITRLSDDGALTELTLEQQKLDELITRLTKRILTRPPTKAEQALFRELLQDGYAGRVIPVAEDSIVRHPPRPNGVSWSNHLSPEANEIKLKLEAMVRQGDPPSIRLTRDWRERTEDVIWALINTPEFVWLP